MPVYTIKCYNGCKVGKSEYTLWPSVHKARNLHVQETGHVCEIIDTLPSGTKRMTPEKPKIPQRERLAAYITEKGPKTLQELYDETQIPESSIRRVLSTHKDHTFEKDGEIWKVAAQ